MRKRVSLGCGLHFMRAGCLTCKLKKPKVMKTKLCIIILLAAFLAPAPVSAQIGSKLKKKLEQSISKAIGQEDSTATGEAANEGQQGEDAEGRRFNLKSLGIGKVTATYDDNYDFKGMMRMRTEVYDNGKAGEAMDIELWFDAGQGNVGMESQLLTDDQGNSARATAVIDMKNRVMITVAVTDGGKTGIIMTIPDSLAAMTGEESDSQAENITVRKTGGTRTVCGYRCDEYKVTGEDGKLIANYWATDDLKFNGNQRLFNSQQGMPRNPGQDKIKGAIMASETYDNGSLVSKSEVTKVDLNATHSISLEGVPMIQMEMKRWQNGKNR